MKKMIKRLTAALLMLTMVFGMAACSAGGPKNDEAFLKNMKAGLEARWKFTDKNAKKGTLSDADARISQKEAAATELEKLGGLSEYQFSDSDLKALAEQYYEALNNQVTGAKYYEADAEKYMELYHGGYNERSVVLAQLVNDYQLTVSDKFAANLDELAINGEKQLHIRTVLKTLTEQLSSAAMEHVGTGLYRLNVENTSDLSLENVEVKVNGMDDEGKIITTGQAFVTSWGAGSSFSEEVYFERDIKKASVMLGFFYDLDQYHTEYVDVAVNDDLIMNVEMPELPVEVSSHNYYKAIELTCTVEAVDVDTTWHDGKCSMKLIFSGTKLFDKKGDQNSEGCRIGWKLYDEQGAVVDSGTCFTSDCTVGEKFRNSEAYVNNLESGNYRLVIMDGDW